ncbi:hypothetical protein EC604_06620 [Paenibacillus amylolyticus]|uniref:Uncharacterized protein n=1 Tax=Paenibacillus amylolyticus TaxID=1451 RepID=A0A5M9WPH7_PAEAM|nr:hypothetical protein [Paenibacillus amylolyticus]KAA8783517.1 hypothetical protein EC604_06620 [Paenibacillus amylolyticus]
MESVNGDQAVNSTDRTCNHLARSSIEVNYCDDLRIIYTLSEVRDHGYRGVTWIRSLKKVSPIPSLSGQHAIQIMSLVIAKYEGCEELNIARIFQSR